MLPRFCGELCVSPYPDGRTWWLDREFVYERVGETITVPKDFQTDFASVPAVVSNLFPRWDTYGKAAVVHDWLYWVQRCPRATADATFLEAMTVLEVAPWKRQTLYAAVRAFGRFAWDDNARLALEGYSRIRSEGTPQEGPGWSRQMLQSTLLPPEGRSS